MLSRTSVEKPDDLLSCGSKDNETEWFHSVIAQKPL